MRTIAAIISIAIATTAGAALIAPDGTWEDSPPSRYEGNGGVWPYRTEAWMIANAERRVPTKAETASHDAEVAASKAAAEAAQAAESTAASEKEKAIAAAAAQAKKAEAAKITFEAAMSSGKEPTGNEKLKILWKKAVDELEIKLKEDPK